ncbi:YicC family protein [Candidatus Dependentiae bacterium]|nr:MAG: YicC family protein [Candidatus Dependentiae bacterium]
MIQSMTGFASKTFIFELDPETKVNVTINIKALNSRFFEVNCKLPYTINRFENDLTKLLKDNLHRGYIYLTVHMSNQNLLKGVIEPAMPVIEGYINAVNKIKNKFALEDNLSLHDLLQLPAIFNVEEKDLNKEAVEHIFTVVQELAHKVVEAREQEGAVLQKDLGERIAIMQKEINAIDETAQNFMEKRKTIISKELATLDQEQGSNEMRKQMLYIALDKIDIHEEIIRFKMHLNNILSLLTASGIEKGKRIDFTLQELAREVNTIAAKCSDAAISSMAINIKVELEKAREQAQNIL